MEDGKGNGEGAKRRAPAKRSTGSGSSEEGSKLSLDFVASDTARETIRSMGFGDAQFNGEFSKFVQYYMARGYARADWNAALISWFQRATPDPRATPQATIIGKVFVVEGTTEWACWQQHLREKNGKGSPSTDWTNADNRSQRGWWFLTKFPPGYDEATGEKLPTKAEDAA